MVLTCAESLQVHVSTIENPAEASFFESFEAAHSLHGLSSSIAEVSFIHILDAQKVCNVGATFL